MYVCMLRAGGETEQQAVMGHLENAKYYCILAAIHLVLSVEVPSSW